MNRITGLHEIHITVDEGDIARLRWYCKDRNIKPILACSSYGLCKNQLMISKFKHGTSQEVLNKGREIAEDMATYGLKVIRLKVEAMINSPGAPTGDEAPFSPDNYWEFHIKVPVRDASEREKLRGICRARGAHLSVNVFKNEVEPLVTLRLYHPATYNRAMEAKADLIGDIKKGGFKLNYGIHQELAVFDDNPNLDAGWLDVPERPRAERPR